MKNKAEKLCKVACVYSKCAAWSYNVSPCIMKRHIMYDCMIIFCHLPLPFIELYVTGQLGSNHHTLLMCFTPIYMHTDGCISAGV